MQELLSEGAVKAEFGGNIFLFAFDQIQYNVIGACTKQRAGQTSHAVAQIFCRSDIF
jgi:hypothetical protein